MQPKSVQEPFDEFMKVVRELRTKCPWDREQTHQSIRHALIEEAYEVVEAIDANNMAELKRELGDLLLHVALHSVIAEEEGAFTVDDVLVEIVEKLIRRHPHVFGSTSVSGPQEVKRNWEKLKMSEGRKSLMDGVPRELPALLRAYRLQEKASKVGFDWKHRQDVWKKVQEEITELLASEGSGEHQRVEDELGDLFFAMVNYARFLHVNPELALKRSTEKFIKRFQWIEEELKRRGSSVERATLEEMDRLWEEGKSAGLD